MTNKINGIDVSECEHYKNNGKCRIPHYQQGIKYVSCNCNEWDCAHKQLKRLQEENEKQKEKIKQLEDFIKTDGEIDNINHEYTYKLQKENEELKAENEQLKKPCLVMPKVKYIIEDFEKVLTDFASCEKNLNGDIPYREQGKIFMNFANVLGTLKNIENEVKNDN